jgi:hypothetical protein
MERNCCANSKGQSSDRLSQGNSIAHRGIVRPDVSNGAFERDEAPQPPREPHRLTNLDAQKPSARCIWFSQ